MINLKLKYSLSLLLVGIINIVFLYSCTKEKKNSNWRIHLKGQGTASSPRLVDLNQDGILDIVLGAGGTENVPTDTAVIALDGADGTLMWHVPGRNQVVGSALFKEVSGDQVPDIFIGGRTGELMCINGASGKVIWRFYPLDAKQKPADVGIYNFYNPQFIQDRDQDGREDLLIANGGNYLIKPHDPNRPAGKLMIISSATGKVLSEAAMPDGKETYMSPVKVAFSQGRKEEIIFGTGGETIGGNLYRVSLQDLFRNDLSQAIVLAESKNKGFIAPPILADITQDGVFDIISNAVDGKTLAIDGATNKLLWETSFRGTELYSSPAIGFFNADSIPDFFINGGVGVWPLIRESSQSLLNGKNGKIEYQTHSGSFMYASPVVMDYNDDGYDDVLMNINKIITAYPYGRKAISQLFIFDFHQNTRYPIGDTLDGSNIACTSWIGDIDKDGKMDIISSTINLSGRNNNDIDQPSDLRVFRIKTDVPLNPQVKWSAYMGQNYDGIFTGLPSAKLFQKAASPPLNQVGYHSENK